MCPNGNNTDINTNDEQLCSNHTFWDTISCDVYKNNGKVHSYGHRCKGTRHQCIYPWYKNIDGDIFARSTCSDKSDRIFSLGAKCPNASFYMDIHNNLFCNDSASNTSFICTKQLEWLKGQSSVKYDDPHNCWDSCLNPGPNCDGCTNDKYFKCEKSGKCLHSSLKCDGHPQDSLQLKYFLCSI